MDDALNVHSEFYFYCQVSAIENPFPKSSNSAWRSLNPCSDLYIYFAVFGNITTKTFKAVHSLQLVSINVAVDLFTHTHDLKQKDYLTDNFEESLQPACKPSYSIW